MEARVLGGVEADVFKQILVAKLSTGFTRFTFVLYILHTSAPLRPHNLAKLVEYVNFCRLFANVCNLQHVTSSEEEIYIYGIFARRSNCCSGHEALVSQEMGCCKSSPVKEKGIEPADIALEVAIVPEVSLAKSPQRLGCTAGRGVDRLHFESMLLPKRFTPAQKF